MPSPVKPHAGRRPAVPVIQDDPPSDYMCTWSWVQAVWSVPCEGEKTPPGVWKLKYISAMCPEHARLPAS